MLLAWRSITIANEPGLIRLAVMLHMNAPNWATKLAHLPHLSRTVEDAETLKLIEFVTL